MQSVKVVKLSGTGLRVTPATQEMKWPIRSQTKGQPRSPLSFTLNLKPLKTLKKPENDWLLDDPFGFDLDQVEPEENIEADDESELDNIPSESEQNQVHPFIVVTPAQVHAQGPRHSF